MHQRGHALGDAGELVVERLYLAGGHTKDGVAVLADLSERDPLAGESLGLVCRGLLVLVPVLVVGVFVLVFVTCHDSEFRGLIWVRHACGEGLRQAAGTDRSVARLVALVPIEPALMRRAQAPIRGRG